MPIKVAKGARMLCSMTAAGALRVLRCSQGPLLIKLRSSGTPSSTKPPSQHNHSLSPVARITLCHTGSSRSMLDADGTPTAVPRGEADRIRVQLRSGTQKGIAFRLKSQVTMYTFLLGTNCTGIRIPAEGPEGRWGR